MDKNIINCTPFSLCVTKTGEVYPPAVKRPQVTYMVPEYNDGLFATTFRGGVSGLPPQHEDYVYIVEKDILHECPERTDLYTPDYEQNQLDTGNLRNVHGFFRYDLGMSLGKSNQER